jgi:hypothetical protein
MLFPQQKLSYKLDETIFSCKNVDLSWQIKLMSVDVECIPTNDTLLLQYFSNPEHRN